MTSLHHLHHHLKYAVLVHASSQGHAFAFEVVQYILPPRGGVRQNSHHHSGFIFSTPAEAQRAGDDALDTMLTRMNMMHLRLELRKP